jgi:hypothetical protein
MAKPNLRLSFIKKYRDRHGKMRFYYRPTGVALPGLPGSREFMAAYHAALGDTAPMLTVVEKTLRRRTDAEGTIDWLSQDAMANHRIETPLLLTKYPDLVILFLILGHFGCVSLSGASG